jgi:hypothetical protein
MVPGDVAAGVQVGVGATVGVDVGNGVDVGSGVDVGAEVTVGIAIATVGCTVGVCRDGEQPATVTLNRARSASAFNDTRFIVYLLKLRRRWGA